MSALEIVLVSVLGCVTAVWIVGLFVVHSLQVNKAEDYNVINEIAEKGKIVLFGDSLTDFYDVQEFFAEPTIYNRGIANDTTDDLLKRMENVTTLQPSKLFLLIGTNDIGKRKKLPYILHNIETICSIITDNSPECKMYIISEYPTDRRNKFFSFVSSAHRTPKRLMELNEMLKKLCSERNYTYIDIFDSLCDDKHNIKKEYTIEGLHLTARGYLVVSTCLAPYINE